MSESKRRKQSKNNTTMSYTLPANVQTCLLAWLDNNIPIDRLGLQERQKRRVLRAKTVYDQWQRNPYLDPLELCKEQLRGKVPPTNLPREAQKDFTVFNFIVSQMEVPNRKMSEHRVRTAANKLMRMGMEQDNGRDIEAGAKLLIKVDKLDQPESEQMDMSKVMFLPPVVVTEISKVDETKEDVDDVEMKRIMQKYGGYIDDKVSDVDEMVEVMASRSGQQSSDTNAAYETSE